MMAYTLPGTQFGRESVKSANLYKGMWEAASEKSTELMYDEMIIDNRTASARDLPEGSLFVRREPQEVRPPSDTGVKYEIKDGQLQISLNNPPKFPVYTTESIKVESPHQLCQACMDALNYFCHYQETLWDLPKEERNNELRNSVVHHFNLASLLVWAQIDECYLCIKLVDQLQRRYPEALSLDNLEKFRTEICWSRLPSKNGKGQRLYFIITAPELPRNHWNFCHYFRMQIWDDSRTESFQVPSKSDDDPPMAIANTTKSPVSTWLALCWVLKCKENEDGKHDLCNASGVSGHLPTRLLDVDVAKNEGRLVLRSPRTQPNHFKERSTYITLSHCWGKLELPVLTSVNVKERHESGLEMTEVPKSFKDAIDVAAWFNVKWLWIDCFCILQDSHDDWVYEANMMSENYKEAFLNISADGASDGNGGFFFERDPNEVATLRIAVPNIQQAWWLVPDARYQFDWMDDSPSFSRAWIHRERQLSPRILHFTEKEVLFECCSAEGYRSETFPGGVPFKRLFNRENKLQVANFSRKSTSNGRNEEYDPSALSVEDTWIELCENLSSKYLTVATDMPIVLSSVAEEFAEGLPSEDRFLAGLWESTLPESLLWDLSGLKPDGLEYIAPSWSWMSVSQKAKLGHRRTPKSRTKVQILEIVDIETKLKYENQPYGALSSGMLSINGIIRRIQIGICENLEDFDLYVYEDEVDEENSKSDNAAIREKPRLVGNSWDEYSGNRCTLRLDGPLRSPVLECYILFVKYEQWKHQNERSDRQLSCLLLESCEDGTYKRLGTLDLFDLFALKMRYKVVDHEPSEDDKDNYHLRQDWEVEPDFETMLLRIQRINDFLIEKREKEQKAQEVASEADSDEDAAATIKAIEMDDSETTSTEEKAEPKSSIASNEHATQDEPADVELQTDGIESKEDGMSTIIDDKGNNDNGQLKNDDNDDVDDKEKDKIENKGKDDRGEHDESDENDHGEDDDDADDSDEEERPDPTDVYRFDAWILPGYEELTPRLVKIV